MTNVNIIKITKRIINNYIMKNIFIYIDKKLLKVGKNNGEGY